MCHVFGQPCFEPTIYKAFSPSPFLSLFFAWEHKTKITLFSPEISPLSRRSTVLKFKSLPLLLYPLKFSIKMRWERLQLQPIHQQLGAQRQQESNGPGKRWGHSCNSIKGGRFLYVFGGYGKDNCQTNQVHVFDTGGHSLDLLHFCFLVFLSSPFSSCMISANFEACFRCWQSGWDKVPLSFPVFICYTFSVCYDGKQLRLFFFFLRIYFMGPSLFGINVG